MISKDKRHTHKMQVQKDFLSHGQQECLTFYIDGQAFGIMVEHIQDVLGECKIAKVPLARPEVLGSINLRGRIVTALNLRRALDIPQGTQGDPSSQKNTSIVVSHHDEVYSVVIDKIGDVMVLRDHNLEHNPATMRDKVKQYSKGVYRLKGELLIVLDIAKVLTALESKTD